jgi:carboxyl-terminal processing protease
MPSIRRALVLTVLAVTAAGATFAFVRPTNDYAFFDPLIDLKAVISERYVDAPDEAALQLGAIRGMIETLNDPYTFYVPPSDTREFSKEITGEYIGIGISVLQRDGWLTVITPLEDSPAYEAGIQAEDRIVEIEGTSTFNIAADAAVDLLAGKPGTPVHIVVERAGQRIPLAITRETIVTRTVKGFHRDGEDGGWNHLIDPQRRIAYVRLTQFNATTLDEFNTALAAVGAPDAAGGPSASRPLAGLIVDVRGNPGGLLSQAVAIADLFLVEGVIVSTRGRAVSEDVKRASALGTLPDFPLAILIDGRSASASEILAAALVENDRAIAIGSRSFGKGSVQGVLGLPTAPGAQLKITEQRYYTPNGRSLHRTTGATQWGVDPSPGFYIPVSDEERADVLRLRREEEIIRDRGSRAPADAGWSDPAWIVDHLKDAQLAAALQAVQGRIDSGAWTPTGQDGISGDALLLDELARNELARERLLRELSRVQRRVNELEAVTKAGDVAPADDLWPDATDLTGGEVQVLDKDGRPISRLRITGPDLERWLIDAPVEPEAEPAGGSR